MPARSPSASSSAWPSTIPTSSTVWWAPVSRSPLASTFSPRRPWRASRSSMWSRKPTPVRAALSPPSRSSRSSICVSAVLRFLAAVRLLIALAPNHRGLAVDREALGAGDPVDVRGQLRGRSGGNLHSRDPAAEHPRTEGPGEATGAAGRQDVVGACGVVAEGGGAVAAGEDAARCGHAFGEQRRVLLHQLQVLG